jgi:hypothetical protein
LPVHLGGSRYLLLHLQVMGCDRLGELPSIFPHIPTT